MAKRRKAILTFIDSSVLLVAWRSSDAALKLKALTVLADPDRLFVASDFVALELLPKAIYHKQKIEQQFYERFFDRLELKIDNYAEMEKDAFNVASKFGLNAMDALHVAAAIEAGAEEFITAERPNSPLSRVRGVNVISLLSK